MRINTWTRTVGGALIVAAAVTSCSRRQPVTTQPEPPPVAAAAPEPGPPAPKPLPPEPATVVEEKPITPAIEEDPILSRSIDEWNRNSPLKPAFFALDSAELDDEGRAVVTANAEVMKKYPTLVVTIEGHADERGTPEYNLALGERRALAVKTYMISLGIAAERLRTVSYGEEFPFAAEHNEAAWAQNRRAHFVITAK